MKLPMFNYRCESMGKHEGLRAFLACNTKGDLAYYFGYLLDSRVSSAKWHRSTTD